MTHNRYMSNLFLAALAVIDPIVETDPDKLRAMADAVDHFAGVARNMTPPNEATAVRYTRRGEVLRHRAEAQSNT